MTGRYEIKANKKDKEAEIWLYDEIGYSFFGDGVTAKQFAKDIKGLGKVDNITVRINSPGGDVFDGLAMYNTLAQHPAKVTVYVDGLAASIASVIAMAGDTINMAENAMIMVHNAWGMSIGNSRDMKEMADRLEKVDGSLITSYQNKTGLSIEEIMGLMDAETWMNAREALDLGFADNIVEELKMAAHFNLEKFRFKNLPKITRGPAPKSPSPDPQVELLKSRFAGIKQRHGGLSV